MPIPLPDLDDRTYADLMEEMRALIPGYSPEWTDHNESDPGIMLIELFAWLAEALIYRLNRIPEASEIRFLELLGATFAGTGSAADIEDVRAETVTALKRRWRAITSEDFEELVLENSKLNVARAKCIPERDMEFSDSSTPQPGHITVVVVPEEGKTVSVEDVADFLDERRLITCCHHVVEADYTVVAVRAEVAGISRVRREGLKELVEKNLKAFFHPLTGGPDREAKGWPFGRDVYASEVFQVIEETEGVEHVESLSLLVVDADGNRVDAGDVIVIPINNLVDFQYQEENITVTYAF